MPSLRTVVNQLIQIIAEAVFIYVAFVLNDIAARNVYLFANIAVMLVVGLLTYLPMINNASDTFKNSINETSFGNIGMPTSLITALMISMSVIIAYYGHPLIAVLSVAKALLIHLIIIKAKGWKLAALNSSLI